MNAPKQLERFYSPLLILLTAYFISDLVLLQIRGKLLPGPLPPATSASHFQNAAGGTRGQYASVVTRNVFSLDAKVLPALSELKNPGQSGEGNEVASPSNLPLTLLGTIVHSNPEKSLAQIEIKSKNATISVRANQSIERLALIVKIERARVTLRNLNNNRLEFIEIKSDAKISFAAAKTETPAGGNSEVRMTSPNTYEINRSDLMKYTSSLNDILQQASSQPRLKPNGEIDGYTITSVQSSSIWAKLGIRAGDTIKAVNGEPVDGPGKAVGLYNNLRSSGEVKITVERDGVDTESTYNIRQ